MVGYVNGRDWNESSGLFFCVFKFATRCESLNMFIEGLSLIHIFCIVGNSVHQHTRAFSMVFVSEET